MTSPAMTLTVGSKVYATKSNHVAMETNPAYNSVRWISKCIQQQQFFMSEMVWQYIELADQGVLRLVL